MLLSLLCMGSVSWCTPVLHTCAAHVCDMHPTQTTSRLQLTQHIGSNSVITLFASHASAAQRLCHSISHMVSNMEPTHSLEVLCNFNCNHNCNVYRQSLCIHNSTGGRGGRRWRHGKAGLQLVDWQHQRLAAPKIWPTTGSTKAESVQQQQQQGNPNANKSDILTTWARSTPKQQEVCAAGLTNKSLGSGI